VACPAMPHIIERKVVAEDSQIQQPGDRIHDKNSIELFTRRLWFLIVKVECLPAPHKDHDALRIEPLDGSIDGSVLVLNDCVGDGRGAMSRLPCCPAIAPEWPR